MRREDPLIGREVDGRYLVEATIGEGGMGVVYRARHRELDRPVALKVLRPHLSQDERLIERFRREARAASAIGHPGIVEVRDFGRLTDGSAYLVMELLEASSLRAALSDGPLAPLRAARIAARICDAVEAAHAAGVVHRDLKPENVLLDAGDHVKVADFGIAKIAAAERPLTSTGEMVGTPLYMSPEQCRGRDVDHRTDVYALGAMLFEMVAGRPPFEGESVVSLVTAHLTEEPPSLRSMAAEAPAALDALVASCLAKDRDERPASMRELGAELERIEREAREALGRTPTVVGASAAAPTEGSRRAADPASDERASDDLASDDLASDERASDERASDERASDERANERANDERASDARANDARANDARANDARANDARANDARASDAHASDAQARNDRGSADPASAVIATARAEHEASEPPRAARSRAWMWIALGVLALAAAGAVFSMTGEAPGETVLPAPPPEVPEPEASRERAAEAAEPEPAPRSSSTAPHAAPLDPPRGTASRPRAERDPEPPPEADREPAIRVETPAARIEAPLQLGPGPSAAPEPRPSHPHIREPWGR